MLLKWISPCKKNYKQTSDNLVLKLSYTESKYEKTERNSLLWNIVQVEQWYQLKEVLSQKKERYVTLGGGGALGKQSHVYEMLWSVEGLSDLGFH